MRVYIGTYTEQGQQAGKGILWAQLDEETGALHLEGKFSDVRNPSFLYVAEEQGLLLAVEEVSMWQGLVGGGVCAFTIEPRGGGLKLLNRRHSLGSDPCFVHLDRSGRYALAANYTQGNVALLPLGPDGQLAEAIDVVQHHGKGPDVLRQDGPHAHAFLPTPDNRYAVAMDLGCDQVIMYEMDLEKGKLLLHSQLHLPPGTGPRHLAFHPIGKYAYLVGELDSTLTVLKYDAQGGQFTPQQTVSLLPRGWQGTNTAADVQVLPSGKFVYASNRGHHSIAAFAIEQDGGRLAPRGHFPCGGRTPRNIAIDPDGHLLLSANQDSGEVVSFFIDADTGELRPTGHQLEAAMAVCVKIVKADG